MVVKEDIDKYIEFWTKFIKDYDSLIKTVAIHSPLEEKTIFQDIFKDKELYILDINTWNLNNKLNKVFDLLIINNVMFMSKIPETWFNNIFNSCKFVIIQDLIDRKRNNDNNGLESQLSIIDSGDSMRYSFSHLNINSHSKIKYDISELKNRIINVNFYNASPPRENNLEVKHFICSLKGDKCFNNEKIIRIDDFPTGIRPILDNLEPLYDILMEFEKRKLTFVLGIVPSLLTDEMKKKLKTFKYLKVAQHGYNHNYNILHKKLLNNNDPYNDMGIGIGQFNEFENMNKNEIKNLLNIGKQQLEEIGLTNIYIPPCNKLNNETLKALEELDFKYILSDGNKFYSEKILMISSNFYGRVRELNINNSKNNVLCFHVTWEWDDISRKKNISINDWNKKLDLLIK